VLARIVHSAVHGTTLVKPGDASAGDSYDYCYVKDCARALMLLQTAPSLEQRVYNVGAGRATSIAEILTAGQSIAPSLQVELAPGRRSDALGPDNYMTLDALARDTGYEPAFDLRAAVADYAAWLGENAF
jgi:UDP-glucose 4-epimerase